MAKKKFEKGNTYGTWEYVSTGDEKGQHKCICKVCDTRKLLDKESLKAEIPCDMCKPKTLPAPSTPLLEDIQREMKMVNIDIPQAVTKSMVEYGEAMGEEGADPTENVNSPHFDISELNSKFGQSSEDIKDMIQSTTRREQGFLAAKIESYLMYLNIHAGCEANVWEKKYAQSAVYGLIGVTNQMRELENDILAGVDQSRIARRIQERVIQPEFLSLGNKMMMEANEFKLGVLSMVKKKDRAKLEEKVKSMFVSMMYHTDGTFKSIGDKTQEFLENG